MAIYTTIDGMTDHRDTIPYTVEFHFEAEALQPSGHLVRPDERETFINAFRGKYHRRWMKDVLDVDVTLSNLAAEFYFWGKKEIGLLHQVVVSDRSGVYCGFYEPSKRADTPDAVL